jgi:DNA polymerase-3 subunit epsilon
MSITGSNLFDIPLVFVDIETNGLNHIRGRVIEVAAIRVEHGVITRTLNTLIDPCVPLPQFITNLTGITDQQCKAAPQFSQIAGELYDILDGAIFVAHNVRFDYSFLKQEFSRLNKPFLPKQLCTVKLSRALYPHEKGHKLADLIKRHNFTFARRHRAYDDAAVLWQFLAHVQNNFPPEQVAEAIGRQLRQPSLPKSLEPEIVKNLPEAPGIYIFEDALGQPLYIGKSVNIKKRVLSHFGRDHAESKEFKISQSVERIEFRQTAGELAALLLESRLIKELQPLYNRQLRKTKKLIVAKQMQLANGYITVCVDEIEQLTAEETPAVLAVYPRRTSARASLNDIVKSFELCPKLFGLEKGSGACFLYQLHKCRGACVGVEPALYYNQRLLSAFERQRIQAWPFQGAILLQEKQPGQKSYGIIVDQWCILGDITQEDYCDPCIEAQNRLFDLDTYKILQSYIATKLDRLKIQKLAPDQLRQLLGGMPNFDGV